MVLFALVVPFVGTALATHDGDPDPTRVDAGQDDSAPAGTCNSFTVTAFSGVGNNTPEDGETLDIRAVQSDNDTNQDLQLEFCDPDSDPNAGGSDLGGGSPNPASGQQTASNAANAGIDCDDDGDPATDGERNACPANATGSEQPADLHDECFTDSNGQCTFGIMSNTTSTAGTTMVVDVWYEEVDDDLRNTPFDTVIKTWTAGAGAASRVACTPLTDTNPDNTRHEFQCTVTDANGAAVNGAVVLFDVTAGPNSQEVNATRCGASENTTTGGTATNSSGQTATPAQDQTTGGQGGANQNANACGYDDNLQGANNSLPGKDTITAWVDIAAGAGQPATTTNVLDPTDPQTTIEKTWTGPARTVDCEPETATNEVGTTHTVTCTVKDASGQASQGVTVTMSKQSGPGQLGGTTGTSTTAVTNAQGQTTFTVSTTTSDAIGTTALRGSVDQAATDCELAAGNPAGSSAGACTDDVTKTWTRQGPPGPAECNDGVDNDADGRIDHPNDPDCTDINDDTETHFPGTFRVATNLTIRYDPPVFKGSVGSPRKRCQQGRTVRLKKVTPGPNRTVGSDTSNREGSWSIRKRRARGRYYAVVTRKTFTNGQGDTIICLQDKSVTINTSN